MELLKPIIVKRWISENKYIKYIFDNNIGNKYKSDDIVINQYIFQDNNIRDALNKIAYHIYNYENNRKQQQQPQLIFPYYCWDETTRKPLLFDIKQIYWKGYDVNPLKSKDRVSKKLEESIEYINNDNDELFNNDLINIVFRNDFDYDNKYYFNKNDKVNIETIAKLIKEEDSIIKLYNIPVLKIVEQNEYYNEVIFEYRMENIEPLMVLFDTLKTDEEIQLIQFANNNNAIYKLYKYHTFDKKYLDYRFKSSSTKKEGKDISVINLYYKNKNIKLSIFKDGIFKLAFKYDIDNGENKSNILHIKDDIVRYLKKFNINIFFKEIDINLRINYSIDNLEYQKLIKKIGTYTNIFEDFVLNKKKSKGVFKYKRIAGNSMGFDLDNFIINRHEIQESTIEEILVVLKDMGINTTINYIKGVINKKAEIQNIKPNNTDTSEKEETIIIIKEYNNNIDFYVDIKKTSSFVELDNLKYWLVHIIEDIRNERKPGPGPKKKIITNIVLPEPKKTTSLKKSSSKSSSSKKSSKSSDSFKFDEEEFNNDNFNNRSSGGDKNSKNDNNYLINKLNNADKELYKDRGKGKNPARKCQKEYQPLVLKKEEIEMLKAKGYDPYDKKVFDNYIEYGSSEDNKNFYTCPRVWCPISNIPLDEAPTVPGESLKCPEENEKPIMMNANMKNENKSRFVYLLKGDIEIPCCGKRNPEKNAKLIDSKKIAKLPSKKAIKDLEKKKKADDKDKNKKKKEIEEIEEIEEENDDIVNIPESPGVPKTKGTHDNGSNENDKNYIMNKIPVPKNRFGGIQKELYYILFDDYKDYTKNCLSNNNINKHNCVLRKGLNNTTNIINSIAYLLGITKEDFIKNIEDKLDILKFLSLENGNVFKDFSDIEPVIPELNKELYAEFLLKYANADKTINIPDMNDNNEKSLYQKSRLLCIYKSYKKFINYLKSEENPSGNIIHYLYTLVAIIYNKLIVLWDVEIGQPNSDVSIVCPRYCAINDLLLYLGKKTKIIMLMTSSENKAKDNEIAYYEPIISKSLNKKESTFFNLDNHKNIIKILNKCSVNINDANKNFYTNLENMKTIKKYIIKKTEGEKDDGDKNEIYRTLIINKDLSINKMILKKDNSVLCIIRFKKLSIIMLDLIIKHLNIKKVLFSEDIDGDNFKINIFNNVYSYIVEKFKKIDIVVDIGEIVKDNGFIISSNLLFKDEAYSKGRGIISNILNKYNDTDKHSKEEKRWQDMRNYIYNKLMDVRFDDKYYNELSKKSRKAIIKTLLNNVGIGSGSSGANKRKLRELQIILEGIDIYSRKNIKDWYSNDLAYSRYNYVNDISNNIKEDGDDLIFTQYLVSDRVPDKITNNGDYLPNTNAKANANIGFYELENNLPESKSPDNSNMQNGNKNQYKNIPENWKGIEKVLTRKWTKYKKKIWSKLRYIDSTYTDTNIYELFKYLLKYDKNLINNIITFEDIVQYTYKEYMDLLLHNTPDIDLDYKNEINMLFKDPHFKNTYITAMNIVNNTNKTFKTTRIFLEDYFYKSKVDERKKIMNIIESTKAIKYYGDILLKQMSINLNINIMVIHHRVDYGKGVEVSKRAGSEDLKVSIKFYNAGDNSHAEILKRPLIILYRKIEKTFIGYYLIKLIDDNKIIYNELNQADEDIKNILKHPNTLDKSSSPITHAI